MSVTLYIKLADSYLITIETEEEKIEVGQNGVLIETDTGFILYPWMGIRSLEYVS